MIYFGSCLCGGIQFEIEGKSPLPFGHCHCRACRKSHGADCTSATIVKEPQLKLSSGSELLSSFQSSSKMQRQFCSVCGSRLFVRFERTADQGEEVIYTVAINCLDEVPSWRETANIFVADKAPWVKLDQDIPALPGHSAQAGKGKE